jgi:hypothetical protein
LVVAIKWYDILVSLTIGTHSVKVDLGFKFIRVQ